MNIFSAIKDSFVIVWRNLILAQPPILFLLIIALLTGGLNSVKSNPIAFFVFTVSFILLIVAFLAGWFYMSKKTIAFELDKNIQAEEKALKSFGLIKHFFPGVGEYFLPVVVLGILYAILSFVVTFVAFKLGVKLFGVPDIDFARLNEAANTVQDMQAYLTSLPPEKAYSLVVWITYMFLVALGGQFVTMWWVPTLFYNTKNAIFALGLGLKFLCKKFWASIGIFAFLMLFQIVVSFVNSALPQNAFVSLLGFLLFFYYITYYVVIIFLYYGQNGEHEAKNYINCGDDCDGEKLAGSETGEKN